MSFVDPTKPNLADFITFCQSQGVVENFLPIGSDYYVWAFDFAYAIVNTVPQMPVGLYIIAVYNLGMNQLLFIAQDQLGQTFFADARKTFGLMSLIVGGVSSSFDNGTGQSLIVQDFMKNLTYSDLDAQKTPWGRAYLGYAQTYGPNVMDVS